MDKKWATISGFAAAIVIVMTMIRPSDIILYNHSPSLPVGFYLLTDGAIAPGALVTVRAVDVAPEEASARGFDDDSHRFIKRVAAISGQHVCSDGSMLMIDGRVAARRYEQASSTLHMWSGCRDLRDGEVLLLGDSADSFDGRYWGPVSVDLITGVWRQL